MKSVVLNLYVGPPLSGKSRALMTRMFEIHRTSPMGYLFVGPSGRFVKEVADGFARYVGSTIPRSNFFVVDQLAVHLYSVLHPERIHVKDELLGVFVADIIAKLPEEELGDLSRLRSSTELVRFTLEAVREAKEEGKERLLERLASNPHSARLVSRVIEELERRYGERLFDTFDAYVDVDPEKLKLQDYVRHRFGSYLFVDGFTSFSWAHTVFLSRLFSSFGEIHMALDSVIWSGERWSEFEEALEERCSKIGKELVVKRHRFEPENERSKVLETFIRETSPPKVKGFIEARFYGNPDEELSGVSSMVKRLIVDEGIEPGQIVLVLNDFTERAREFQRKLTEYGVPTRLEGDEPLANSRAVQLLMLPLRTVVYGYPPEMLMSLIDHGVGDGKRFWHASEVSLGVETLERLASAAALYAEPPRSDLRRRRENWFEKLTSLRRDLSKKVELLESEDELSQTIEDAKRWKEECERLTDRVEALFEFLKPLEAARTKKTPIDVYLETLRRWTNEFSRSLDSLGYEDLVSERMALRRFEQVLDGLEVTLKAAGVERATLDEFIAFLQTLLQTESYKPNPDFANTVEILTLENARFKRARYKIFAGFVDGVYPIVRHNPLYPLQGVGENPSYYRQRVREQEENFYTSLKGCERAIFSVPVATREGEPLTPSFWLKRLPFEVAEDNIGGSLDLPMSKRELRTIVNWAGSQRRSVEIDGKRIPADTTTNTEFAFYPRLENVEILRELLPRTTSYTRFQDYRDCPFKFFLKYVMGLREPWEETYDLSPLELGTIYHRVLKSLYDWAEREGKKLELPLQKEMVEQLVDGFLDEFVGEHRIRGHEIVRSYLKKRISKTILDYLKAESENEKSYVGMKTLTERPFRLPLMALKDWLPKTALKYGDLEIVGRIDRIDLFDGDPGMVVSDYKRSGNAASWDQLELYVLVLLGLDDWEIPHNGDRVHALYRILEKGKGSRFTKQMDFLSGEGVFERSSVRKREERIKKVDELDEELLTILDGIYERGEFPQSGKCWNCKFSGVCKSLGWRSRFEDDMGELRR